MGLLATLIVLVLQFHPGIAFHFSSNFFMRGLSHFACEGLFASRERLTHSTDASIALLFCKGYVLIKGSNTQQDFDGRSQVLHKHKTYGCAASAVRVARSRSRKRRRRITPPVPGPARPGGQ
jgi:hypothetical protein